MVRFIKSKSDMVEDLMEIIAQVVKLSERNVKLLRDYNAFEFLGKDFQGWHRKKLITHHTSPPYYPE